MDSWTACGWPLSRSGKPGLWCRPPLADTLTVGVITLIPRSPRFEDRFVSPVPCRLDPAAHLHCSLYAAMNRRAFTWRGHNGARILTDDHLTTPGN